MSRDSLSESQCSVTFDAHRCVRKAVSKMWNNEYDEANRLLEKKKKVNPRYALEYAQCYMVKTLMCASNKDREILLDLFQAADSLATSAKYNPAMFSDDDDDDEEEDNNNNNNNVASAFSSSEATTSKKDRKQQKKEFKKSKKEAEKKGVSFDQTWQLECDIIYADALLMRAICQLMMNSYFKGGINMRKAWGYYHSLIKLVEEDKEGKIPNELKMCIKYGTGTFYAFLALVPANLMKLLSVIGFISDRDLGEQYLTEVLESNTIRSPFAALVLCCLYLFLPTGLGNVQITLQKAKHVLDLMNEKYPNNTYFHGYSNFYYRKKGETQPAVDSITLAAENAEKAGAAPLLIKYLYADTLFMDLQWAEAKKHYENVLNYIVSTKTVFAYTGQVVLSLAACCVMLGDNKTAMDHILKVNSMYNPKSKNDANSPKFAARVIANNKLLFLSAIYMLYINRDLAHMGVEQAERVLKELERITDKKDLSGVEAENMKILFVGVIHKGCERTQDAMESFQKIINNEKIIPQDSMILPYTYYEMGELYFRSGHHQEAKQLFEKGSKIKGDGNETLSNRYNIAQKQLKKIMSEKK